VVRIYRKTRLHINVSLYFLLDQTCGDSNYNRWCCPRKLKTKSFVHVFLCVIASLFLGINICGAYKDVCIRSVWKGSQEFNSRISPMISMYLLIFAGFSICCTVCMRHHHHCDIGAIRGEKVIVIFFCYYNNNIHFLIQKQR
jgi:hypothetical protein